MAVNEFLKTLWENINEKDIKDIFSVIFQKPQVKFDIEEFPQIFSEKIDSIILAREAKNNEEYVGGNFNVTYVDEKNYRCSFELYFQDKDEKINSFSSESEPLDILKLTEKSIKELQSERNIKFEIPEPSREARDKFNREKVSQN